MMVSEQLLNAANGSSTRVLGETILHCQINDYLCEIPCLVTDQVDELILGLAWLEERKAQWNFGEKWIKIDNQFFPIYSQNRKGQCRKIAAAQESLCLPRQNWM